MHIAPQPLREAEWSQLLSALPSVIEVRPGDCAWHFITLAGDIRLRTSMRVFSVQKAEDGYIDPRHVRVVNAWLVEQGIVPGCYAWREPGTKRVAMACWRFQAAQRHAAEIFATKWLHGFH
jgi:hypothetical protein